jgi:DNA-binding MarR family transcriptional regulator
VSTPRSTAGLKPLTWQLKQLRNALHRTTEDALLPLGLTEAHAAVLMELAYGKQLSNAALARASSVTPQSMLQLLRSLEERGLIRRTNPKGGRAMPAELTPEGRRQVFQIHLAMRDIEQKLLGALSPEERNRLRGLLERCLASLLPEA